MGASGSGTAGAGTAQEQGAGTPALFFEPVTPDNIDKTEREVIVRVNKAIVGLESAIAQWDANSDKPEDLQPEFDRYKLLHDALVEWETDMLRGMAEKREFYERIDKLKEFVRITDRFA